MAEFVKDSRGNWVLRGTIPADAAPVPVAAPKVPTPPRAPATQPRPKGFWGQLMNDLRYEVNATFAGGQAGRARALKNAVTYPGRLWLLQSSAISEIQRNGIEAVQTVMGQRGDYASTRIGAQIDRTEEFLYRNLGLTPPSQQQGTEALLTGFGTEAAAQVGMAAVGGALLSRATRVAPFLKPVQNALNPAAGRTLVGKTGRFVAAAVADEAATTPFVNNTGGSAVSLVNMVLGTNIPDPVTPEMNRIESMRAGLIPNTAFSLLAGGSLLGGASAVGRFRRSAAATRRQQAARTRLEQQGVVVSDPDTGATGFAEPGKRPTWKDVERELGIEEDVPDAPVLPDPQAPARARTWKDVEAELGMDLEAELGYQMQDRTDQVSGLTETQARLLRESGLRLRFEEEGSPPFLWAENNMTGRSRGFAIYPDSPQAPPPEAATRTSGVAPEAIPVIPAPERTTLGEPEWSPVQEALQPRPPGGDEAAYSNWLQSSGASTAIVPARPGDAPVVPPWAIPYDPALPEADTLLRTIDEVLDPDEVAELAQGKGPVIDQIEDLVASRQPTDVNPDRTFENSAAPSEAVSQRYRETYRDQLEALAPDELRDLALNSPEVSIKTTEVTGKAPEEFTKSDVIEGLLAIPDQLVLVNRVGGRQLSPMLRVEEIEVDPVRFQFKGNTDADGVQAGNSLEGVERWNPDLEGVIQVWVDPADGRTYVVNGHNRLAKAKGLGIPTMRVTYLNARTAEQARAMGAMANIAEGGGTAFDAAKFLREAGITSTKQLKELDANLVDQRSLWVPGLALSRLPDDAFLMAVNGTLDLDDAVMLGKSGLSPETMSEVAKVALRRGWTGPKLAEMLAQGEATKAVATKADQVDLFGNEEVVNKQELKADLAIRVETLIRTDRNAFRSAGRNAESLRKGGNVIDEITSGSIADEKAQALKFFSKLKYEVSAIGDLLNEGVEELANGAQLEPIAARIAREMPAAIELDMGKKPAGKAAAAPVEADAPAEAPAPAEAVDDGSLRPLEAEIEQKSKEVQSWEKLPQQKRDAKAEEARKLLLSDRKRANREAKAAELNERQQRWGEWMDDDTAVLQGRMKPEDYEAKWGARDAEEPPVTAPTKADWRPVKELEADSWARDYLAWYDAQPRQRLQGTKLEKAKAAVVSRAIDAGEVRPPATPIPDELPVPDPNLQAAADELSRNELGPNVQELVGTEMALREAYEAQDATARMMDAQEERIVTGYDFKPLEDVRAEVVEAFVDPTPLPARPAKPASDPTMQPVVAIDALIDQSTVSIKVTKAEADYLRTLFINPDDFADMPLRDAEAMLVTIPDQAGAARRLRKKLQAQVEEGANRAMDEAMAMMPAVPEGPTESIADRFGQLMRAMAESDARLFRTIGETVDLAKRATDELAGGGIDSVDAVTVDVQVQKVREALPPGKTGQPSKKKLAQARSEKLKWTLPSDLARMSIDQKNAIMDAYKAAPGIWQRKGLKGFVAPWEEEKWARFVADRWGDEFTQNAPPWAVFDLADGPNGQPVEGSPGYSSMEASKFAERLNNQGRQQAREIAEEALAPYLEAAEAKLRDTAAVVADEQVAGISAEVEAIKQRASEEGC